MASIFRAYMHQLRVHTLRTQMLTSAVVMGLGNIITQQGVSKRGWDKHDWKATTRFAAYGCFIFTPVANRWHYLVNRIQFSSVIGTTLTRLVIDMSLFAPFATTWFFLWMGLLEGRPLGEIRQRWETNFTRILTRQWMVFGPAQAVNMTVVPVYARPPVMNMVGLGWSTYLSLISAELERESARGEIPETLKIQKLEKIEVDRISAAVME
ncbi:hypothetical protein DACRYDRAFT_85461 [Dacryopinax primogenitus]|uniref:Uncharacterized protein n=1 Tax=Dacryopinax primogenitus (strain DJM 731) TaxID=1858805 RepID=M5FQK4_DACPD|nr:uncharacterized protein DACRYDRAFT_85461 [Dacryopinax primogenitus]EJT97029.1 hypothetical protein DACRYDRAFT_85461 [Dacryopinax primogenitus]